MVLLQQGHSLPPTSLSTLPEADANTPVSPPPIPPSPVPPVPPPAAPRGGATGSKGR